jgi:hypothetical protein
LVARIGLQATMKDLMHPAPLELHRRALFRHVDMEANTFKMFHLMEPLPQNAHEREIAKIIEARCAGICVHERFPIMPSRRQLRGRRLGLISILVREAFGCSSCE